MLLVGAAEAVGYVPRGTHHWDDFITPEQLDELLSDNEIVKARGRGVGYLSAQDLIALSVTGPMLRAAGVALMEREGMIGVRGPVSGLALPDIRVPGDFSSAAFMIVAGVLRGDLAGLGSAPSCGRACAMIPT